MDILLAAINAKWIHPSLALRLLKANLGALENRCQILEFALRQPLNEKIKPILAARPGLLGLSVSIWNHLATLELLKALHTAWQLEKWEARQKPIVILGGPEVSWLNEEAEIFRYADYVIRGEGELSFRSLCFGLLDGRPQGKVSETGKKTVFINQGSSTVNLSEIASPYSFYTDEDLKRKHVYVEASRGCPFGCEFCHVKQRESGGETSQVRYFPLSPFLTDMETLIDRGGRTFKFLDRSFNLDMDRSKKIMGFFLDKIGVLQNDKSTWPLKDKPLCVHFEMVPSRFPPELKELIRRFPAGTLRLEIGIQTFNRETSALIGRHGQPEIELEVLEFIRRETNTILHVDLIAGLPGEGLTSFAVGFDRLWQVLSGVSPGAKGSPFEIQLGILKCLPGTPIARHNETYQMKYSSKPPYEVIETGALSAAELDSIKNFARFWEVIVNRNPFPDLVQSLLPPGKPAFDKFMRLSGALLGHFGRNWGIDRAELRSFLVDEDFPDSTIKKNTLF